MSFMAFRSAGAPYKVPQRRRDAHNGRICTVCGALLRGVQSVWCLRCYPSESGSQRAIDFTPAARELAHAVRKRETKAQAILARLQVGKAGTAELARIGGVRFGARILELRQQGHRIVTEGHADHAIYSLEEK